MVQGRIEHIRLQVLESERTLVVGGRLAPLPLLRLGGVLACHDYDEDTCPGVRLALDDMLGPPHELVDTLAIYRGLA